jgi:hypothetical protein
MHNHDNNNQGYNSKMMWLMMLPCLLIPAIFLVVSGRGLGSIIGNWQWIAPIAFMISIHVLMMKFMHNSNETTGIEKEENKKIK